jgi:hypothetical protein
MSVLDSKEGYLLDRAMPEGSVSTVGTETFEMSRCVFKTIYFPRERTRAGTSARVTISLPLGINHTGLPPDTLKHIMSLDSRQFRLMIGDPYLEDLEQLASAEGRSFSNTCLLMFLQRSGGNGHRYHESAPGQLELPFLERLSAAATSNSENGQLGVTFRESRHQGPHGWYPYVEGFSATYVRDALLRFDKKPRAVYDPFGGAGTTQLTASLLGASSFFSEVNPFMTFVAETKVNSSSWAVKNLSSFGQVAEAFLQSLENRNLDRRGARLSLEDYESAFPDRDFFDEQHLRRLLAAREIASELAGDRLHIRNLLLLACAANVVHSSHMTRRADLRRRRSDEYKTRVVDVGGLIAGTIRRIFDDLSRLPAELPLTTRISDDARLLGDQYTHAFDFAITSPP